MIKLYQTEWFGIPFTDFASPSLDCLPPSSFYESFYKRFHSKYSGYCDLPSDYKKNKEAIAEDIKHRFKGDSLLSIGCGNGYVESLLSDSKDAITALEPSKKATKWLERHKNVCVINGYFPQALNGELDGQGKDWDEAYSVALDYVFNKSEYVAFLKSVAGFGIKKYAMYGISTSSFLTMIRRQMSNVYRLNFDRHEAEIRQFWGYVRTRAEHVKAFNEAGFDEIKIRDVGVAGWVIEGVVNNV